MKQSVEVRTPVATGDAQKLGKVWRKQVLPFGKIRVGDRTIDFTPAYCGLVADAFADQAYDTAPIMLADKTNDHTMALLDSGGEVLGLDVDEQCEFPGLYATVKLSAPVEEKVTENPRCGVSVRIRENYDRADGKFYPAAMQHLLLTWDPKVPGMKPWEQVDLSNSTDQVVVIDLSNYSYGDPDGSPGTTPTSEGAPTMGLTDKELAELRATQERVNALLAKAGTDDPDDDAESDDDATGDAEVDEAGDAEFAAEAEKLFEDWDADVTDDDTDPDTDSDEPQGAGQERELVSASNDADNGALDLSNSDRDALRQQVLDMSNQLDESNYRAERDQLARTLHLPPALIDMAEPLLKGKRNIVELSNGSGEKVDAGKIVRDLLGKFGSLVQLLDLSAAIGADEPETTEQQEIKTRRQANVDAILANIN